MNNSTKLDAIDKKILLALDMDARAHESLISKKIKISKQMINYRIKRLEQKGIIKSYYAVIDHTKIGYKLYRIALNIENAKPEKEKEIIQYLKQQASWIVSTLGNWNIFMAIYFKDEYEFMKFWNIFYQKYSYFIENKWISIMTKFANLERSFILPENKNREEMFQLGKEPENRIIDEIDYKILTQLGKNARQTSLEVSQNINETERIVRYRIKRLELQKIILGYRVFIDTTLLGLKYYKIFLQLKDIKFADFKKINYFLTQNPNIIYITEALGGYDLEFEAQFIDSIELNKFINNIKNNFPLNIKKINHIEYIDEYKIEFFPNHP